MDIVDRGEVEMPALLARRAHRLQLGRKKALENTVGVAEPDIVAFSSGDMDQLLRGAGKRGFGLPGRIFGERMHDDEAHLVVQSLKTAERVEHAVAPQELVGGRRQAVAIGAELQFQLRAMVVEVTRDDAVLHYPSKRHAIAAGRPGQLSRERE